MTSSNLEPYFKQHYLQSQEWASVKTMTGWRLINLDSEGQKIHGFRKLTPIGGVIYIPGWVPKNKNELSQLTDTLKKLPGNNLVAKLETCTPDATLPNEWFTDLGWQKARSVQYTYTVALDLTISESEFLDDMKSRSRRDLRLAQRRGVIIQEVEPTDDQLEIMLDLLQTTSKRKSFTIRNRNFVLSLWQAFRASGKLKLYFAVHDKDILSGAIILTDGSHTAWYKDGGSSTLKASLCAPRLLFFELVKKLKQEGYQILDLGGIPNPATHQNSHMQGIYRFKTGYASTTTKMMPSYELPLNNTLYKAWPKVELGYLKASQIASKMWY